MEQSLPFYEEFMALSSHVVLQHTQSRRWASIIHKVSGHCGTDYVRPTPSTLPGAAINPFSNELIEPDLGCWTDTHGVRASESSQNRLSSWQLGEVGQKGNGG